MKIKLTNRILMIGALFVGAGSLSMPVQANTLSKDASKWSEQTTKPTLDQIREAQMALNRETSSGLTEDGLAGPATESAVRMYQTDKGLNATGLLDTATLRALNVEINPDVDRTPASLPYDPEATETMPK